MRLREGDPDYLDAVVKEVLRARPALTIAPRRLLEPVEIGGAKAPRGSARGRLQLARAAP
jgi:cytochrome P450